MKNHIRTIGLEADHIRFVGARAKSGDQAIRHDTLEDRGEAELMRLDRSISDQEAAIREMSIPVLHPFKLEPIIGG